MKMKSVREMVCLAVLLTFLAGRTEAGSMIIPAWAFEGGNVVIHADPDEYADAGPLFEDPKHPYTIGLLRSIPRVGRSEKLKRLSTIKGMVPSLFNLPKGCLFSERCPDVFDQCQKARPDLIDLGGGRQVRCYKYV